MKRAVTLVIALLALCVGISLWCDGRQLAAADAYLDALPPLRQAEERGDSAGARERSEALSARWRQDEGWLDGLVSHEYTRAVDSAMLRLNTALENGWRRDALHALDDLNDAFGSLSEAAAPTLSNLI